MIVVACQGGLGNQMFQYALYKRLRASRPDVFLDLGFFVLAGTRSFELAEAFKVEFQEYRLPLPVAFLRRYARKLVHGGGGSGFGFGSRKLASAAMNRLAALYDASFEIVRDIEAQEVEDLLPLKRARWDGYWQAPRYFKGVEASLRRDFAPRLPLPDEARNYLRAIESSESVSAHIRRGDYVANDKALRIYGDICTNAYYRKAIKLVVESTRRPSFFVFSDDIAWAKQQDLFDPSIDHRYVDTRALSPWVDMFLMSRCKHNILANSSYSWWATWLNENPTKIVVAPSRWINEVPGASLCDLSEIYQPNWIRV